MRLLVVLPPLLILALTVHVAQVNGKPEYKGHGSDSNGDGEHKSNNGVGPVKNPHCPKPGLGPDPHGNGHGPQKNTVCDR